MGLTKSSVGKGAAHSGAALKLKCEQGKVVALAGNPNVGKSTVFNALTGLKQHTGNWPGKTVSNAKGYCKSSENSYVLVDVPGTYSLMAHSAEESVARNFICFGKADAVVVVCDATCLERNLNLVLQTAETTENVIVCVNLMDEAKRKGIKIDLSALSRELNVPVVGTTARKKKTLDKLLYTLDGVTAEKKIGHCYRVKYPDEIEDAVTTVVRQVKRYTADRLDPRWTALKLLERDDDLIKELNEFLGFEILNKPAVFDAVCTAEEMLLKKGITREKFKDSVVSALLAAAKKICDESVTLENAAYNSHDRKIDRILTGKYTAYPVMIALLALVFWITVAGANYPSEWLSRLFAFLGERFNGLLMSVSAPEWLRGALYDGVYRVLTWVTAVMLPPMAIFFPLFTLLEDLGYLPRIAYNLDKPFKRCKACGKQALTICMGFGCNAAGIVGCRIIDSPRERLLAVLTNNFAPCNGRFPLLISVITMFFIGSGGLNSVMSALFLTAVIVLSVAVTLIVTKLLSCTLLKGVPSSFTLELPPYRVPQPGRIIVRSVCDRTAFVLGRAMSVAAPAGLIIWLAANIKAGDETLLSSCAAALDPLGRFMGLDGVILIAFILGFPANEIVIPIIIMAYMSAGTITDGMALSDMFSLLTANGWNWVTAVNVIIFSVMHWPCSTTLLTIKKETGSVKWTVLAALIPTAAGFAVCVAVNFIARMFGLN